MSKRKPNYLFLNGEFVAFADAKIHALSTVFKYAAAVFEGIRAYFDNESGQLYIFRLREHLDRLERSCRISRIQLPIPTDELEKGLLELIRRNELREDLHIRLVVYVGEIDGRLESVSDVGVMIAAMPMGRYDPLTMDEGLRVCVSSWKRISDDSMPPRVKAIGNYHNSRLALLDARAAGFQDAILLDSRGRATEGPGYNLFMVRNSQVLTPPVTSGILEGVTRDTLIRLFSEIRELSVVEREIDRTELYLADELFFCGSGKEVSPISSVDNIAIGTGGTGRWTAKIRDMYSDVAKGKSTEFMKWLTPVW
jgi:branched-chain amino acid aminotransferase